MCPTGSDSASGLLLVDKPAGPTSHDIVQAARRALGVRRIGHTGTLDPFANGLLLLAVGSMTRMVEYFHALPKTYETELELGVETDTHDPTGKVSRRSDSWRQLGDPEIEATLASLRGELRQVPPAYSAKKVGGERAYEAARSGRAVELEPVTVRVHELQPLEISPPRIRLRVRVSTGTYIRAIARDLGSLLGCGAYLTALRRTAIGPFQVADALPGAGLREGCELAAPHWLSPARAVDWLQRRELDGLELELIRSGRRVPCGSLEAGPAVPEDTVWGADLPVALLREGRLIGVAERAGEELQPRKVFSDG
jgi:tRNA pseudouridine55 synthase